MKYIIFIAVLACISFTVKAPQGKSQELRLDISNANGGTVSQIFDEVNYIPLESTPQSLINRIDKILITDEYYIILDGWGNQILLFNKKGKFHSKIDKIPGVEKPPRINALFNSFTVDRERKEIIVSTSFQMVGGRGKIFYFDFDGKFIKTIPLPLNLNDFVSIGNDKLLFKKSAARDSEEALNDTLGFNLLNFSNGSILYKKLLPFSPQFYVSESQGRYWGGSLTQSGIQIPYIYFTPLYDYSLYQLDSIGVKQKYSFIFPLANSLPPDFISNKAYTREFFTKTNTSIIYGIGNVYSLKNWLTFRTATSENKKDKNFFYNTLTGSLLSAYRIQPDSKNYFLPLGFDSANPIIMGCDDEYFYCNVISSAMFNSRNENQSKNLKYNDTLNEYFKTNPIKANPVLVQLKPKQRI